MKLTREITRMKTHLLPPLLLALAACGAAAPPPASTAAQQPGPIAASRPADLIHARYKLMEQMDQLMVPIDSIQAVAVKNPQQLRANGKVIAAMLLAVPHLFPPNTNLYDPKVAEPATLALPAIWKNFDTFQQLALATSRTADEMGLAEGDAALRAAGNKLRAGCNACHVLYLRKYVPQKPQASDQDFDFDAALDPGK
jgi:cytochrome c556